MEFRNCLDIIVPLLFISLVIIGLIALAWTTNNNEIKKCTNICEKKGAEYYSLSLSYSGFVQERICQCLDVNGNLVMSTTYGYARLVKVYDQNAKLEKETLCNEKNELIKEYKY